MRTLIATACLIASCAGCANNNFAYDLLFGAMQPFYSDGGPGLWDQKRDFDDRVEAWREQQAVEGEGE